MSPFGAATLEADKTAFVALMKHLKAADPRHTVLMLQVENEINAYGSRRDYSPEATKLFEGQVPRGLCGGDEGEAGNVDRGVRRGGGEHVPDVVDCALHRADCEGRQGGVRAAALSESLAGEPAGDAAAGTAGVVRDDGPCAGYLEGDSAVAGHGCAGYLHAASMRSTRRS